MKVLIVGAGAVGLSYGYHLQRGGAEVCYFVREKYAEAAREGFTLYALNAKDRTQPLCFQADGVLTSAEAVAAEGFDQLWLAVSSPALRGAWLSELLGAATEATVICLTPGMSDRALLLEQLSEERLVMGVITLVAYQAPLPGEERFSGPGLAFWFPPLAPAPFSGAPERVEPIVATLRRGGQPASSVADAVRKAAFGPALLMPLLAALEAVDWRWDRFRGAALAAGLAGNREALAVVAAERELKVPWVLWALLRATVLRSLLRLMPWVVPIDMEVYLAWHFTKVGDQTRQALAELIARGRERGLGVAALEALLSGLSDEPDFSLVEALAAARTEP